MLRFFDNFFFKFLKKIAYILKNIPIYSQKYTYIDIKLIKKKQSYLAKIFKNFRKKSAPESLWKFLEKFNWKYLVNLMDKFWRICPCEHHKQFDEIPKQFQ